VSVFKSVLERQKNPETYACYEVHIQLRGRFCHSMDISPEKGMPRYSFPRDKHGYYFPASNLKSAIRAWAHDGEFPRKYVGLGVIRRLRASTAIYPERLYVCNWDGSGEPAVWQQRFRTFAGSQRRTIKQEVMYFDRPYLRFIIWHYKQPRKLGQRHFKELFAYGEHAGLGAERRMGAGEFVTTLFKMHVKPSRHPLEAPAYEVPIIDIPPDSA